MEAISPLDVATSNTTNLLSGLTGSVPPTTLTSYTTTAFTADPRALYSSFLMIIISEIGDKTFLIAAILSMRQSKLVVFAGAFASLAVMSVLSAMLGVMFPSLLPKSWTNGLAAVLFAVFGVKMLKDAREMKGEEMEEEWREAEREIEEQAEGEEGHELDTLEQGDTVQPLKTKQKLGGIKEGTRNLCGLCFSPTFAQAFILTFLGEWGDRSQIATIALAAAHNVALVCLGTIVGHACCTSMAVLAGSWLARRISVKHVTLGGAGLFLLFAVIYAWEAWSESGEGLEGVVEAAKGAVGAGGLGV
ncbi:GCR1-dependent translation factor 1 [Pseudozyma hubeiensis]|nr:GCR1-dependent translation factor 1 [Pseudozyma hubeiensis]